MGTLSSPAPNLCMEPWLQNRPCFREEIWKSENLKFPWSLSPLLDIAAGGLALTQAEQRNSLFQQRVTVVHPWATFPELFK